MAAAKFYDSNFVVVGVPIYVVWNADGWRIFIGGQLIDRDCDVFSSHFISELDKKLTEYEKDRAELMAEQV